MESLLPSEIARLVLGYLEEQKCNDAARSFLETCPHLQEIRTVISSGRRFSTRVNGFTLSDVLDTFCSASAIIHERMSKVSDCDQLKHCGDLLEQLKFLVDGSRGQRFFVNINVPPTSQTSGGSPIISSSMRKRHHSGSDRDRSKRANKLHSNLFVKSSESVSSQLSCNAIETTPLENLPGNSGSEKVEVPNEKTSMRINEHGPIQCSSTVTETIGCQLVPEARRECCGDIIQSTSLPDFQELTNLHADMANRRGSAEKQNTMYDKCSAATDTEELTLFTNTEVQTTPYDVAESETELTDEPVENLSLLTKELLNRTELQERIAENINKAILPADVSQRDASMTESLGGEMNTSIMTELNNAIKSVVIATESDPVFAKFLDDIIGPSCENDTSPDEDDLQTCRTDGLVEDNQHLVPMDSTTEASSRNAKKSAPEVETTEVPLKNRLRSSSSQQIVRPDEDRLSSQKPHKKEDTALEDMNAAAILSIINVNNKLNEVSPSLDLAGGLLDLNVEDTRKIAVPSQEAELVVDDPPSKPDEPDAIAKDSTTNVSYQSSCNSLDGKSLRKTNARKARVPKQNPIVVIPEIIPETLSEVVQTLVYYPQKDIPSLVGAQSTKPRFVPIAPKIGDPPLAPDTIFLKSVTVPKNALKSTAPNITAAIEQYTEPMSTSRQTRSHTASVPVRQARIAKDVVSTARAVNTLKPDHEPTFPASEFTTVQRLTLYGENSAGAVLDETEVPAVQNDVLISSFTGTGLSPYLKSKSVPDQSIPKDTEINDKRVTLTKSEEAPSTAVNFEQAAEKKQEASAPSMNFEPARLEVEQHEASTSAENSYDLLTKRTPRTLLKSRSKNHRLSCSTPRRSSHIRALDFTTPTKIVKSARRMSANETLDYSRKSSNFAKSLFKSSPFVETSSTSKKSKSPTKDRSPCEIPPIATRSPAPKLMGGWDKCNGIGMILGSASPSSTSCSPVKQSAASKTKTIKNSWDADLRRSLQLPEESPPKVVKKQPLIRTQNRCRGRRRTSFGRSSSRIQHRSRARESIALSKKFESEPPDVSVAPATETTVEESLSVDVADKPIDTAKKIQVAEASKCPSSKAEEAETIDETAAARHPDVARSAREFSKTTTNTDKSVKTMKSSESGSKTDKTAKKKYAQVRTITTSVTRLERGHGGFELASSREIASETVDKSSSKLSRIRETDPSEPNRQMCLPDMLDLETPRKIDNAFGIPPTPRLLSPSSSITTPFGLQAGEDSGKMRSFITTPEFPPTPSIAVTPKQICENTVDSSKKEPYYHPSSELKDPRLPRSDHSRHEMSLPLLGMIATTRTDSCVTDISVQVAQGLQACTTSNKLEVTQFAVIKDNLSREETFREIKISASSIEHPEKLVLAEANEVCVVSSIAELDKQRGIADANSSGSTVDDDSSDSDSSDSSSDTSSSTSSSSSSDASATNTSAVMLETITGNMCTNTSRECSEKPAGGAASAASKISYADSGNVRIEDRTGAISKVENESSPRKVFALVKNEEDLKESIKETPAKDDSFLPEAVISETPSSSKVGIETLTNLNTKISALITSQDREVSKSNASSVETVKKSLPKVVSVERIFPDVSIALKSGPVIETLYSTMQSRSYALQPSAMSNAKLSRQLEEKRLRIVAKVKEKENPPAYRRRIKPVAVPKRRSIVEKKKVFADEVKHEKTSANESHKPKSSGIREIKVTATKDVVEENVEKIVEITTKAEKKKSQILKELFGESLTEEPENSGGGSMEESEESLKITVKNDRVNSDDRVDDEKNDDAAERRKDDAKSKDKFHSERSKEKNEPETKVRKDNANRSEKNFEEPLGKIANDDRSSGAKFLTSEDTTKEREKEECVEQRTVASPIESKTATKSRVDLVKRDLFSDEESSDQRTTRSRTRQTFDAHKSDSVESHASVVSDSRRNRLATPKEDMPGVLECLELVPTMKNDVADEDEEDEDDEVVEEEDNEGGGEEEEVVVVEQEVCAMETSQHHAEYHFIYDDSVPTKRRKRRYSSSDLEFVVQVEISDDNYKMCSKLMTATPYEEIFNLSPPRRKRGPNKKTLARIANCRTKSMFKDIDDKPLATSSPVFKSAPSKVPGKVAKLPAKKCETHQTDGKKRTVVKTEKPQPEHEKPNPKSRKRKASVSNEGELVDKKSRITEPAILLSKLANEENIDKLLDNLHGPL